MKLKLHHILIIIHPILHVLNEKFCFIAPKNWLTSEDFHSQRHGKVGAKRNILLFHSVLCCCCFLILNHESYLKSWKFLYSNVKTFKSNAVVDILAFRCLFGRLDVL